MWRIETEQQELFDVNMMISMEVCASGSFTREEIKESFHRAVAAFLEYSICVRFRLDVLLLVRTFLLFLWFQRFVLVQLSSQTIAEAVPLLRN